MASSSALPAWRYGVLGLPLAMAALPVYVQTPKLYGDTLGLDLALLGLVLFLTRIVDTVQDPWLGRLSDRLSSSRGGWRWLAVALLALGLFLLFNPPAAGGTGLALWLGGSLLAVFFGYSMLQIDHLAWGSELADDERGLTRYSGAREAAAIIGVMLASVLPALLAPDLGEARAFAVFSLLLVTCLLIGAAVTLSGGHRRPVKARAAHAPAWKVPALRRLSAVVLLNGLANALPATLVLFFIADVLRMEAQAGLFLLLYFGAALCGLPLWMALTRTLGLRRSWLAGLLLATAAFCSTPWLQAGDGMHYAVICLLAGLALGADLALPPALLASTLKAVGAEAGDCYGWWVLLGKASLAVAAGLALPLLDWLGYRPGGSEGAMALAWLYAGLPCLIKLIAAVLLLRFKEDVP